MWFLRKPPVKVNCFFCKIELEQKDVFQLQYNAADGVGTIELCPMCAGMLDDMKNTLKDDYN